MTILILIITITWSFGGGYQSTPEAMTVFSPEHAARIVYERYKTQISIESDQWTAELYEVDLKANTVKKIKLPKMVVQYKYD